MIWRVFTYLTLLSTIISCKGNVEDSIIVPINDQGDWTDSSVIESFEAISREREKSENIGVFDFRIRHIPYQVTAYRAGATVGDSLYLIYKDIEMYHFKIRVKGFNDEPLKYNLSSGRAEYLDRVKFYSFYFQNSIHLICGNDTLACKSFHFERDYGISPYLSFIVGFENKDKDFKEERYLAVQDMDCLQFGKVYIRIN